MVAPLRCRPRAPPHSPPGAPRCRSENERYLPAAAAGSAPNRRRVWRWDRRRAEREPESRHRPGWRRGTESDRRFGPVPAAPVGSAPNRVCRADPGRCPGPAPAVLAGSAPNRRRVRCWDRRRAEREPESRHRPSWRRAAESDRRLRSGTSGACWFCAEPVYVAPILVAARGRRRAEREPESRHRPGWRRGAESDRPGTGFACWFCAEPVVSRRFCSLPGGRYRLRLLVLRRTGCVGPILVTARGRYQRRLLVLRRSGCVGPILVTARGRYQRRLLVLRRTGCVAPILVTRCRDQSRSITELPLAAENSTFGSRNSRSTRHSTRELHFPFGGVVLDRQGCRGTDQHAIAIRFGDHQ